jgi:hypothetical protein
MSISSLNLTAFPLARSPSRLAYGWRSSWATKRSIWLRSITIGKTLVVFLQKAALHVSRYCFPPEFRLMTSTVLACSSAYTKALAS